MRSLRVMIVEDEGLVAMELQTLLTGWGHTVVASAGSVEQACAMVRETRPEVAILDVNLRGRPVTPVAELLAEAGTPFLLVSGYGREDLPSPLLQNAPMLSKPLNRALLRRSLERLVGGARE